MTTPFDAAIEHITRVGYHNHRKEDHSDVVCQGIYNDLLERCDPLKEDVENGLVRVWYNVRSPGDRLRKVDLFIGEAAPGQHRPNISKVRIAVENKSVVTAHRNKTSRFDDLKKVLGSIHSARPEAVLAATVMIGLAERVLNIPDGVHKAFRDREGEFKALVLPRLSSGDQSLWSDFSGAVSKNRPNDPALTVKLFKTLPTRRSGHTHVPGFDFIMLAPVFINNVDPPTVPRSNALGIDIDAEYDTMLAQLCNAYVARWHM